MTTEPLTLSFTPYPQTISVLENVFTATQAHYWLEMNSGMLRFEFTQRPNWWWRWWQFVLLGWRWREM
jgi:hypothetical protein